MEAKRQKPTDTRSFVVDGKVIVPAMGSRRIQKHLSILPLKGTMQNLYLDMAVDSRNWETGEIQAIKKTNAQFADPLHVTERTVKRITQKLTEEGLLVKRINQVNKAGNIINLGIIVEVPEEAYLLAELFNLERTIKSLELAGYHANDKREEFQTIYEHLEASKSKLILLAPKMSLPGDKNVTTSCHQCPQVVSQMSPVLTRAAANKRSTDNIKTYSLPELSEYIEILNSKNIFSRYSALPNTAPLTKSHKTNLAKEMAKGDKENVLARIESNLKAWEASKILQLPRLSGACHVPKRLLAEDLEGNAKRQCAVVTSKIKEVLTANSHMSHKDAIEFYAANHGLSIDVLLKIFPEYQAPRQSEKPEDTEKMRGLHREITELLDIDELSYFTREISHTLTTVAKAQDYLLDLKQSKVEAKDQKSEPKKEQIEPAAEVGKPKVLINTENQSNSPVAAPDIKLVKPLAPEQAKSVQRQEYVPAPGRNMSKAAANALAAAEREDEAKKQAEEKKLQERVLEEIKAGFPKPVRNSIANNPVATAERGNSSSELRRSEQAQPSVKPQGPQVSPANAQNVQNRVKKESRAQFVRKSPDTAAWFAHQGKYAGDAKYLDFVRNVFPNIPCK